MQIAVTIQQVKRGNQSKEPVDMVSMDMTDKDVVYFSKRNAVFSELSLGSFATINQKEPLIYIEYMSGKISFRCR